MGTMIVIVCVSACLNLALWAALFRRLDGLPLRIWSMAKKDRADGESYALTLLQERTAARVGAIVSLLRTHEEHVADAFRAQVAEAEIRARISERRSSEAGVALSVASGLVRELREWLYPPLAHIANEWADRLGERRFPVTHGQLAAECAAAGQARPTPLLLHYGPGDHANLHQDLYGDIVFPLQVAIMLSKPGEEFEGGESVFVEQQPRSQSRAIIAHPAQGQGIAFPVRHRPVLGSRGYRRHAMRHGTGDITRGNRTVLGIIFHNAR